MTTTGPGGWESSPRSRLQWAERSDGEAGPECTLGATPRRWCGRRHCRVPRHQSISLECRSGACSIAGSGLAKIALDEGRNELRGRTYFTYPSEANERRFARGHWGQGPDRAALWPGGSLVRLKRPNCPLPGRNSATPHRYPRSRHGPWPKKHIIGP